MHHIAHVDIGYFGDGDTGLLEGRLDCNGTELGRGNGKEGAIELFKCQFKAFVKSFGMTRLTLAVGVLEALRMYASLISCCRAALAEKHRVDWALFRHVIATPALLLAAGRRQAEYILNLNSNTHSGSGV